jgi:hypothetical protein
VSEEQRSQPADPAPPSPPATHRQDLLLGGVAVLGAATVTFGVLMTRPTPAAEITTPRVVASTPEARSTTPSSPAAPAWSDADASLWLGARRAGVAFDVRSDNVVNVWMNAVQPILVVRCAAGKAEAFVVTHGAARLEADTDDHTVTFRFDDGPETRERWPDSAEHDALFAPDGAAFADRLMQAQTLVFGFTPHNASPVLARFNVSGLEPRLRPAAKACGWPAAAAAR